MIIGSDNDFDDRLSNQIKEAYYGSFLGFSFGFVEPGAEGFDSAKAICPPQD